MSTPLNRSLAPEREDLGRVGTHLAMAFTASRRDSAKLTSSEERVTALNPART